MRKELVALFPNNRSQVSYAGTPSGETNAMLFKSEIVTQVSGSIGGTTYSHNTAGLYRRARAIPVNPNTAFQQAVRNNFTTLALAWSQVLTQFQRDEWENYAVLTPTTGKLGDPLTLSGQQMYIRCNATILAGANARVDVGPTVPGLTELTAPVATASIAGPDISVAYDNGDAWAIAAGGGLTIQTSRFLSPGKNFFKGPYRILATVDGDATPPTSPETSASNAFGQVLADATAGQKLSMRYVAFESDGRISAVTSEMVTVIA